MIILDTNVLSALIRRPPDEGLVDWLGRYPEAEIFLSTITVFEAKTGIARLPVGRRRAELELHWSGPFRISVGALSILMCAPPMRRLSSQQGVTDEAAVSISAILRSRALQ